MPTDPQPAAQNQPAEKLSASTAVRPGGEGILAAAPPPTTTSAQKISILKKRDHEGLSVRWQSLLLSPTLLDDICAHVAEGGTVIDLATMWEVPLGWVTNWLRQDKVRSERFTAAEIDRGEWIVARVLQRVEQMTLVDPRELHDKETGEVKPVSEWTQEQAAGILSIEYGIKGKPIKVKMINPLVAAEVLGKEIGLFRAPVEVNVNVNIADSVKRARQRMGSVTVQAEALPAPATEDLL